MINSSTQLYSTVSTARSFTAQHSVTVCLPPAASPTILLFASLPLAVLLCASLLDPKQTLELPPDIRTLTSLRHADAHTGGSRREAQPGCRITVAQKGLELPQSICADNSSNQHLGAQHTIN